MSDIVPRLLNGDGCVAVTRIRGSDGRLLTYRTELSSLILRNTHFWGLSPAVMIPNAEQTAVGSAMFAHSDCLEDLDPLVVRPPEVDVEQEFDLVRGGRSANFVTSDDYEPIWSSAAGDDPAIVADVVAQARDLKMALCVGDDLWFVQRCVLPQFMKEAHYFRLSTPECRVPFFTTWERHQFEDALPASGARSVIRATTFQAGVIVFSDGRFIWFNTPSSGSFREYQELRVYASRPRQQMVFAGEGGDD